MFELTLIIFMCVFIGCALVYRWLWQKAERSADVLRNRVSDYVWRYDDLMREMVALERVEHALRSAWEDAYKEAGRLERSEIDMDDYMILMTELDCQVYAVTRKYENREDEEGEE
jgi:hypothetical protein